jgi:glycogen synthase
MKKIRVLLVSLLKPVNDTRMFEKLGQTLSQLPEAEIHICGYEAPPPTAPEAFRFHPLFRFRRLGTGRIFAQYRYWRLLLRLRPAVLIVGTHELLLTSLLYKLRHGGRLLYDVRENYALNIRSQAVYPPVLRQVLAGLVRLTEHVSSRFVDHYLLAEQSYAHQLPFLGQKFTVLENKVPRTSAVLTPGKGVVPDLGQPRLRLLYSGTISRLFGVFEAVDLCRRLRQVHPGVELTIIGYCSQPEVLDELRQTLADKPYITLIGGDQLVPHPEIIKQIRQSHFGLLPYRPHPSTSACIPTKLYEYMGHTLPMLIQYNPVWQPLVERHQAGLFLDFPQADPAEVLSRVANATFYKAGAPEEVFWDAEAPRFLQLMTTLLPKPL